MLQEIFNEQKTFYQTNQTLPVTYRLKQLRQLQLFLTECEDELLLALNEDLGKSSTESYLSELGVLKHSLTYTIKKLATWCKKKRVSTPIFLFPARSYSVASPYGNTLIISAYNYPVLLALDPLIGALAGGNVAMVGLSEQTRAVNRVLMTKGQSYFDRHLVYFYESNQRQNQLLLTQAFDKIFFTGSPRVGRLILEAASDKLIPVTLELGGKSPALVTESADVELAASRIVWGKFLNVGQTCVAPDYCLVDKKIAKKFQTLVKLKISEFYGEEPAESSDYGRLISAEKVNQLGELLCLDAPFVCAGGELVPEKRYIEPTVLMAPIEQELATMSQELFGPILPILVYSELKEAEAYIASRTAPLAFYPFSNDKTEIRHLLETLNFGGATVNDTVLHLANPNLPFGGFGQSGMGRYHGKYSFETFTHEKAVLERKNYLTLKIMHPPFSNWKERLVRLLLK
ncbi:aldehyde dehydrogenase family protein [Vagococcus intermedius]|uniref:Aldehyde dehydrogenase n=1 Tax=Vagococcus intermedius TaxID=2991418 RepID=A0AAF0I7B1_9ENTE|nr:aldehyde dehydrogenase family protein [Vagococcus intermedius]WEG73214.1 aldehyde dehydrogenase family protein [Vagococcus intermedius]WEG75299.1 aldehyde dehydrogenase family protein [Vagococcus intermedius]